MNFHTPDTLGWTTGDDGGLYRRGQCVILSYQEFMDGVGAGKESISKNEDAYIWHGELFVWHNNKTCVGCLDDAHCYNLMSSSAFKAKHPDKLKFGEWEVTIKGERVDIGCKRFDLKQLRKFHKTCQIVLEHTSLQEAYTFLNINREKLDI